MSASYDWMFILGSNKTCSQCINETLCVVVSYLTPARLNYGCTVLMNNTLRLLNFIHLNNRTLHLECCRLTQSSTERSIKYTTVTRYPVFLVICVVSQNDLQIIQRKQFKNQENTWKTRTTCRFLSYCDLLHQNKALKCKAQCCSSKNILSVSLIMLFLCNLQSSVLEKMRQSLYENDRLSSL